MWNLAQGCGYMSGGALARRAPVAEPKPTSTPTTRYSPPGSPRRPELGDTVRAHVQALKDALRVWRADHDYYNFLETPAEADATLLRASYQRLREIKAKYDPDQAIISTHPVQPAGRDMSINRCASATSLDPRLGFWDIGRPLPASQGVPGIHVRSRR
jgi:berberine-like enzyme